MPLTYVFSCKYSSRIQTLSQILSQNLTQGVKTKRESLILLYHREKVFVERLWSPSSSAFLFVSCIEEPYKPVLKAE